MTLVIAYDSFRPGTGGPTQLIEISQHEKRREASRVVMRVPVEVRGTAPDGIPLVESTYTGVIGAPGAMIWLSRMLQIGTEVELTSRFSQRTAKFRVAWVKDRREGEERWETGVESLRPLDGFWGVRSPPKVSPR
jgi:hypothetical protein